MCSNVFESAKKVLNDLTCPRCKNYSFCHDGTDEEMKSCIYLSVYLSGYRDAVDYFDNSIVFTKIKGIKHQNELEVDNENKEA